jgi:DNA-binding transcriptional regulator YdaS (Cro superfamily)
MGLHHVGVSCNITSVINQNVPPTGVDALREVIRELGQKAVADALGVSFSTPGMWLNRKSLVPAEYCARVEQLIGAKVRRQHLRPNDWHLIWPELNDPATPPIPDISADAPAALGQIPQKEAA